MLTAGTNVRIWDLTTGKNSHVIAMKQFTKVDCMSVQPTPSGEVLWCGHSDGQVTCTQLVTIASEPVLVPIFNFSPHKSGCVIGRRRRRGRRWGRRRGRRRRRH